jgi:hypothetical protein
MTEEFSGCLRMTELFNTPFETSLRVLLTLRVFGENMTLDKIAAVDFMTIYAQDFGIAAYNLNGDNGFCFSEAASKRTLISKALKQLVLDRLISAIQGRNGFTYDITVRGAQVCDSMTSDYTDEYIAMSQKVYKHIENKLEVEILAEINKKAVSGKEE